MFREEKIQTETSYLSPFSSHLIGCFDLFNQKLELSIEEVVVFVLINKSRHNPKTIQTYSLLF